MDEDTLTAKGSAGAEREDPRSQENGVPEAVHQHEGEGEVVESEGEGEGEGWWEGEETKTLEEEAHERGITDLFDPALLGAVTVLLFKLQHST